MSRHFSWTCGDSDWYLRLFLSPYRRRDWCDIEERLMDIVRHWKYQYRMQDRRVSLFCISWWESILFAFKISICSFALLHDTKIMDTRRLYLHFSIRKATAFAASATRACVNAENLFQVRIISSGQSGSIEKTISEWLSSQSPNQRQLKRDKANTQGNHIRNQWTSKVSLVQCSFGFPPSNNPKYSLKTIRFPSSIFNWISSVDMSSREYFPR